MKKIILFFAILMSMAILTNAQNHKPVMKNRHGHGKYPPPPPPAPPVPPLPAKPVLPPLPPLVQETAFPIPPAPPAPPAPPVPPVKEGKNVEISFAPVMKCLDRLS